MDIINIEIIVWLVLTIFVILSPLGWIVKKYLYFLISWFHDIRNIQLSKPEWINNIKDKVKLQNEKMDMFTNIAESPQETGKEIKENIIPINQKIDDQRFLHKEESEQGNKEKNKNEKKVIKQTEAERKKRGKKIASIKYSAIANKERGKKDLYEKKLIEGLAIDPTNMEFLILLSDYYFEEGHFIKALSLLKKIINTDPNNHKAIRKIGQIYLQQNQPETAQLLVEKAISLKNDHPKYHITLVEIYYENRNLLKATQIMEKVLKLRPSNINYLLTMATLYEESKKPHLAKKYYSKVLEIDPGNTHAKRGLKRMN